MAIPKDIGVLFPGQGSQYPGMGKEVYDNYERMRELYQQAEEISGTDWAKVTFESTKEELKQTENTQPAIFLNSIAYSSLLKGEYNYIGAAGHSLGEYTALYETGVLSFEDALKAVCKRGELMGSIEGAGGMLAVIGAKLDDIEESIQEVSSKGIINVANYNSPIQVVVSGEENLLPIFEENLLDRTRAKVIELPVSAAFHSPLMEDAASDMKKVIEQLEFNKPKIPYFSNVTGKKVTDPDRIRELLEEQILSPVKWIDVVKNMKEEDIEFFVEIGPGKVLKNLVNRIDKSLTCEKTDTKDKLESFLT